MTEITVLGTTPVKRKEPILIDKISDSSTATEQIAVKLATAAQTLYIRDIVLGSPDCTDTNNIIANFYIIASDASADGGADTTSPTVANLIGGTKLITKDAGATYRIPVDFTCAAGEDLIVDITVAAGTPTLNIVAYYRLLA